jgi:hypothetical protein
MTSTQLVTTLNYTGVCLAYKEGHRVDWDDARILDIERNSRYRKYKESAHMTFSTNPISQSSSDISSIWIPSSVKWFLIHKEGLCGVTDSSCFSIRFQSLMLRVCSTDGTSDRYYMPSQFLPCFITLVIVHLVLLVMILAEILSPLLSQFHTCACFITNFYCRLSCYLPQN